MLVTCVRLANTSALQSTGAPVIILSNETTSEVVKLTRLDLFKILKKNA